MDSGQVRPAPMRSGDGKRRRKQSFDRAPCPDCRRTVSPAARNGIPHPITSHHRSAAAVLFLALWLTPLVSPEESIFICGEYGENGSAAGAADDGETVEASIGPNGDATNTVYVEAGRGGVGGNGTAVHPNGGAGGAGGSATTTTSTTVSGQTVRAEAFAVVAQRRRFTRRI